MLTGRKSREVESSNERWSEIKQDVKKVRTVNSGRKRQKEREALPAVQNYRTKL